MNKDYIDKLPPDAQKEFLKLAMKLNEKTKQSKVHDSFLIMATALDMPLKPQLISQYLTALQSQLVVKWQITVHFV